MNLEQIPVAKTATLIRMPVSEVFEAFVNPNRRVCPVLAGAKAFSEHNISLNLIVDRFPKGI